METPSRAFWAGVLATVSLIGCKGDSSGPDFEPIPGVTGKLAYIARVDRTSFIEYQIRILDLQTGAIRTVHIAPPGMLISAVTWHPDGQSLAITTFTFSASPSDSRLLRVNEDGSGAIPLFDRVGPEFNATYSRGGSLAYCGGFTPNSGLFIDAVSAWPADCSSAASPSWFPDESAVAMVAYVGGVLGLYQVDLATKSPSLIVATPAPGNAGASDVSPQGDVIAAEVADATGWNIHLIQLDGSGGTVLPGTEDGTSPQWSADASRIVFVKGFQPYVYELASGAVTRIIDVQMNSAAWLE